MFTRFGSPGQRAPRPTPREIRWMSADLIEGPKRLHERYGQTFGLPIGPGLRPLLVTRDPEFIEHVLVTRRDHYRKGLVLQWLDGIFGNSILVSEGAHWRKQRRLMAPSFTRRALSDYAEIFVRKTDEALLRIEPGVPFDVNAWTMEMTLDIVLECLFGAELGDNAAIVARALDDGLYYADSIIGRLVRPLPKWVPTAPNRARKRAMDAMYGVVDTFIRERRQTGEERRDLLGLLLAARDEDGGSLSDAEVREEVVTLLLAGHETTALNIAYTFMLLGWNPHITEQLQQELSEVVGNTLPSMEHLRDLPQSDAMLKESLRLFPPAAVISRQATQNELVGPYAVPAWSQILMPIRAVHYDERWYPEPDRLDLGRWTPEEEAKRPRYSFMPFGGGNRVCIGEQFARMEARLVTARILQRFTPTTVSREVPPLKLTITLRNLAPILVRFDARPSPPEVQNGAETTLLNNAAE